MRISDRFSIIEIYLRRRKVLLEDLKNILRYGVSAPRLFQEIYVVPQEITRGICCPVFLKTRSVRFRNVIIGGSWGAEPMSSRFSEMFSAHIRSGVPWEKTFAYDRMLQLIEQNGGVFDGCRNQHDIENRYRKIDVMIDEIRNSGRMKSIREIDPLGFRELGGIHVGVTRSGEIVKAGGGTHRLHIARELDLPYVPACLDVIHPVAIQNGAWRKVLLRSRQLKKMDYARY